MATVQELILAAQAKQKPGLGSQIAQLINAASSGYDEGTKLANVKSETDVRRAEVLKQIIAAKQMQDELDAQAELRRQFEEKLRVTAEQNLRGKQADVAAPEAPTKPAAKFQEEWKQDEKGRVSRIIKEVTSPDSQKVDTIIYRNAAGENRIGKKGANGEVVQSPSDPLAPSQPKEQLSFAEQLDARDKAKLAREKPKAAGSLKETLREYDNMIREAEEIKKDQALPSATGLDSFRGKIPGTDAKRVHARMQTLKAKTLLNVLGSLKQLSATGASGFGALSEVEGEQIRNSVSTLDLGQQEQDVKDSLDRFVSEMQQRKQTLENTFNDTYGGADGTETPAPSEKIKVKRLSDGQTGTINASDFDPAKYERL